MMTTAAHPGLLLRLAAVLLTLLMPIPSPGPGPTYPPPPPTLPAITVLSVGDSLTVGVDGSATASYRGELSRLAGKAGQPITWVVAAVGGTKCSYWSARLDGLITQYQPDLILLDCGTNDTPTDDTQADYTALLTVAANRGVRLVASLIGLPDMRTPTNVVRPDIDDWMHLTNDRIEAALSGFPSVPVADTQRVPATLEWLQPDGIHWLSRTDAAVAWLFYTAARSWYGWPAVLEPCGLFGSWYTDPEPVPSVDYRVC